MVFFLSTVLLYVILIKLIHMLIKDKHGRMPLYKQMWIVVWGVQYSTYGYEGREIICAAISYWHEYACGLI